MIKRPFFRLFPLACLMAAAASRASAQTPADSARAAMDSLEARLARAEDAITDLRRQVRDAAGGSGSVQSRSRNRVELSGLVLFNGWYNNALFDNSDVPHFVANPQDSSGMPNASFAAAVRQSRIGVSVSGMSALGAQLSGDLQLDFFGGQQPSTGGRTFPLPRIRTAFAKLDWRHFGLLVGQETQIVSPLNPVSFASVGTPEFTTAGNLWFWVPQVRLSYETGNAPRFGLQGALLAPMLGAAQTAFNTAADVAEKSGRPMFQGRGYFGWGDGDRESQIGIGIHRGWYATAGDTLLTSEALTADVRLAFGDKIQLLAEGYYNGRALAGLGGGGIGQSFGAGGVPVDARGGWAQLNIRPTPSWELGGGIGLDDPDDADLPAAATSRLKNMIFAGHVHHRPGGGLIMGVALRRIETTYAAGAMAANHINGFVGLAF